MNNQVTQPTPTVHVQQPSTPYPVHNEMKESSFINSGIMSLSQSTAQCHPSYGVSAVQTPHRNVCAPGDYEQRKLAEQNEYYFDTIPGNGYATEQPPGYDAIHNYCAFGNDNGNVNNY